EDAASGPPVPAWRRAFFLDGVRPSAQRSRRSANKPAACGRDRNIWRRTPGTDAWSRAGWTPESSWSTTFTPAQNINESFRFQAQHFNRIVGTLAESKTFSRATYSLKIGL